jgi:hypothetical protein
LFVCAIIGIVRFSAAQSAGSASIQLQIQLEGRPNAGNFPLDYTLSNGTQLIQNTGVTNASGQIEIAGIEPGTWMLRVMPRGFLAVSVPLNLVAGQNKVTMGPFKTGDANLDNQITMTDFALLSSAFNRHSGMNGFDARADFNGDNQITLVDFSLLAANHGQKGAAPLALAPQYPSQLLDLRGWKITLPIPSPSDNDSPWEVLQPQLTNFHSAPWFQVNPGGGILFRAPVNGVTTSGSGYPRSELREMTSDGRQLASWSSTSGTHTMFIDQMITAVPTTKRHIVVGQIHDSGDDVIVIRLEYPNLYVNVDGRNVFTLDNNYTLGERFQVRFVVSGGRTQVFYNNAATPAYILTQNYSRAYFKAGAYTQSNCQRENQSSLCNANNYGEVIIYQLAVSHQ